MKCALITGSTSVLGGAIAKRISSDLKLHIILHYNNSKAKAEALKAEILAVGGSAELMQFDVTDHVTVVKELAKWKEENSGNTIDVLVNNAGILKDNLLVFTPEEDWRSVIDTKVLGFYNVTSALIRDMMLRRHGRIITVASLRGLSGGRGQVNYSAANGANTVVAIKGNYPVNVQGTVAAGDDLTTSATARRAQTNIGLFSEGVFAFARAANPSGAGTINCELTARKELN